MGGESTGANRSTIQPVDRSFQTDVRTSPYILMAAPHAVPRRLA